MNTTTAESRIGSQSDIKESIIVVVLVKVDLNILVISSLSKYNQRRHVSLAIGIFEL
jgi:hypothetical protein